MAHRLRYTLVFIVVIVGMAVAALSWWYYFRYETLEAEGPGPRFLYLPDGSSVWLRPGASVRFADYPALTAIAFRGEGLVEAGSSDSLSVTAGVFSVRLPPGAALWVRTGSDSAHLHAQADTLWAQSPTQLYTLLPDRHLLHLSAASRDTTWAAPLGNRLAWQNGQLQFQRAQLDAVVADLTAYFGVPFSLGDASLAKLRFSGAFLNPTPTEVLDVLSRSLPLTYAPSGKGYTLQPETP